jgi:hypothetical protein
MILKDSSDKLRKFIIKRCDDLILSIYRLYL